MTIVERRIISDNLPVTLEPKSLIVGLIMGKLPTFNQLFNLKMLKSFFWTPDPALLKEGRDEIQKIFKAIIESKPPVNAHVEALINRLLSVYPYLDPVDGETITLSLFNKDDVLQAYTYTVKKIEITSIPFSSPLVGYGLTSADKEASPILLFKGTTFPADSGFLLSLMADSTPFHSVGSIVMKYPSQALLEWMKDKNNIIAVGQSLGGALAQHAARLFPKNVVSAVAINAPKFMGYDNADKMTSKIARFDNEGDLISKVGTSLPDNSLNMVIQSTKPYGLFLSHIRSFESDNGSKIVEETSENALKGKVSVLMTFLHQVVAPILFVVLAIVLAVVMVFRAFVALSLIFVSTFESAHRQKSQPEDRQ